MIDKIIADEEREILYSAIRELSGIHKTVIMLYLEEKTDREIGEQIGISQQRANEIRLFATKLLSDKITKIR
jgi:DNA-directed RNA polymerase specialized sigma subunit